MTRLRATLIAALIAGAAAWVYAPALHGDWLWDDPTEILQNPDLRQPGGFGRIWSGAAGQDYFPLKTSVQWVEWRLWHDRVEGYHWVNLGLHLAGALLLWRVLRKLGAEPAWLGGLLFAVHPLAVESVAWIAELKNVLALPLLLMALDAWLDFDAAGHRRDQLRAWLMFTASLLAKTSGVMLPALLLLHAWWRRGRIGAKDLAATAPFFASSLALGLVTVHFQSSRAMAHLELPAEGIAARLGAAGPAALFYLGQAVLPIELLPIYPRWTFGGFIPWRSGAWGVIGGALLWAWCRRATWGRTALFGLGAFGLALAPVLGLVPMAYLRISRVSDHFAYLALAAGMGLGAAAAGRWRAVAPPLAFWPAAGLAVAAAAIASHRHARIFASEETLWRYTLAHNPSAWLAENNLAVALARTGRTDEAIAHGEAAVRLQPDWAETHSNLGVALTDARRWPEAIRELETATRLRPDLAGMHVNLGRALLLAGRETEALPQLEMAHRLDPGDGEARRALAVAHNNRGNRLARAGDPGDAVAEFTRAIALDPANPGTHRNLGYALHALGRNREAMAEFDAADRLEPGR
jgi:tetratricopeptide (TPR) repeat protein